MNLFARLCWRRRLYTATAVLSLVIGLTAAFLILLFVRFEFSYDTDWPGADTIYKVEMLKKFPGRPEVWDGQSPFVLKDALKKDFPEIEDITHFYVDSYDQIRLSRVEEKYSLRAVAVDVSFFDVFKFRFLKGDGETALKDPNSIVLTASTASRIFGAQDPIGQLLSTDVNPNRPLRVTGIVEDLPANTHLVGDYFFPIVWDDWVAPGDSPPRFLDWSNQAAHTYITIPNAGDADLISAGLREFEQKEIPDNVKAATPLKFRLTPITSIYFDGARFGNFETQGERRPIIGFMLVALLVLALSCSNFINMLLAVYVFRVKEVAIRRVLGARNVDLIALTFFEILLVSMTAIGLSLLASNYMLPIFDDTFGLRLAVGSLSDLGTIAWSLLIGLTIAILATVFVMWFLLTSTSARVLRNIDCGKSESRYVRQALLVFQFAVALALIPMVSVVFRQIDHMENAKLGFQKNGILALRGMIKAEIRDSKEAMIKRIAAIPGVKNVALSAEVPGDSRVGLAFGLTRSLPGGPLTVPAVKARIVGANFFETYGISPRWGRTFDRDIASDQLMKSLQTGLEPSGNIILNSKAAKALGFNPPGDAVGQSVHVDFTSGSDATIIGIVDDLPLSSLKLAVGPEVFLDLPPIHSVLSVAFEVRDTAPLLETIRGIWRDAGGSDGLDYVFVSQNWNAAYQKERRLGRIFAAAALIAIVISLSGLYGLAYFETALRRREIAIRKILGGTFANIALLLMNRHLKKIGWAAAIAMPASWYFLNSWLSQFPDRVKLEPVTFLATIIGILFATVFVVGRQTYEAAMIKPNQALHAE